MNRWMLTVRLPDLELCAHAVTVYVLNRTVHHVRRIKFKDADSRKVYVEHYLNQQLHEAVRGHAKLRKNLYALAAESRGRKRCGNEEMEITSKRRCHTFVNDKR